MSMIRTTAPMELVDNTLHGMIVPWMVPARVMDDDGTTPYLEQFDRSAFDRQIDAGADNLGIIRRIELRDSHDGGRLGYALELDRGGDGLFGTFRVLGQHIDDVRRMHDDGIDGLSMRFHPAPRGSRVVDGVVTRLRAVIEHVGLVAVPAYDPARVLSLREDRTMEMMEADELAAAEAELVDLDGYLESVRTASLRWQPAMSHTVA